MVQNIVNRKGISPTSGKVLEAPLNEPIAVDLYAEQLMEDLFDDVDQMLGENTSPTTPLGEEVVSLKTVTVPKIVLPKTALPPSLENSESASTKRKKESVSQLVDRILVGAAFTSLVLSLGLWFAHKKHWIKIPIPVASVPSVTPSVAPVDPKVEADSKFLEYIERSLDKINQPKIIPSSSQGINQTTSVNNSGNTGAGNLPTVIIPGGLLQTGGLAPAIDRLAEAIQKQESSGKTNPVPSQVVIIPPNNGNNSQTNNTNNNPPNANQKTAENGLRGATLPSALSFPKIGPVVTQSTVEKKPRTTEAAKATKPTQPTKTSPSAKVKQTTAQQTSPQPSPNPPSPNIAPPSGSQPTPPVVPFPPPSVPSEPPTTPSAPVSGNTLVGILELGDHSAALFEIDGVARRFYVGESIGGTGWTLVEVKNQEAKIRKGSETRSVFVGQKF